MSRGFTLVEVVIAVLVLELGIVGAVGILALSSRTLARAERLERVAAYAEGVLDSLAAEATPSDGSMIHGPAHVAWTVGAAGALRLVVSGPVGDTLLAWTHVLPPPPAGP